MRSDIYFNVASWFPRNVLVKPHFNPPNEAIASCWEPWSSATKSRWRSLEKIHLIKLPQRASLGIFALSQTFSLFPTVSSYFWGGFFNSDFKGHFNMYYVRIIFDFFWPTHSLSQHKWAIFYTRPPTLISLITVEVGANVEGVQKMQNQ